MFLPKRLKPSALWGVATMSKTKSYAQNRHIGQRFSSHTGAFRSRATATVFGAVAAVTAIISLCAPSHPIPTWNSLLPSGGLIEQTEPYTRALNKLMSTPFDGNVSKTASLLSELAYAISTMFPEAASHLFDNESAFRRLDKGAALGAEHQDRVGNLFRQTYGRLQQILNNGKYSTKDERFAAVWSLLIETENSLFVLLIQADRYIMQHQLDQKVRLNHAERSRDWIHERLIRLFRAPCLMPGTILTFQQ
ncbi:hypothetical protein N0V93_007566 [Gnomoniopsis smithogilvyi]|uniref:Uncharacterized protein n=1 Tax=Gnomoniopsis smithogilvyi TaxID=1191159 RepID=A0A9W9CVH3_9PEZI|nr:hypothetical protein N0V93_007566 [Gnomoniopsis smithogilvyi]